jgi:hypothetical protein
MCYREAESQMWVRTDPRFVAGPRGYIQPLAMLLDGYSTRTDRQHGNMGALQKFLSCVFQDLYGVRILSSDCLAC